MVSAKSLRQANSQKISHNEEAATKLKVCQHKNLLYLRSENTHRFMNVTHCLSTHTGDSVTYYSYHKHHNIINRTCILTLLITLL